MPIYPYPIYLFLLTGMVLSVIGKKLTVSGAITAGIVGLLVFKGGGYMGIAMLTLFFIAGSAATRWQIEKKQKAGTAERAKGQRTAGQVIANGGVAALLGGIACFYPEHIALWQLMMAGSLAAAIADTLSSELGVIYGRRFYDVITFKKAEAGPDGIISIEGTMFGATGAVVMAVIYSFGNGFSTAALVIVLAGIIGNLVDSVLGATLERRGIISNNTVNLLNTLMGAGVCLLLWL